MLMGYTLPGGVYSYRSLQTIGDRPLGEANGIASGRTTVPSGNLTRCYLATTIGTRCQALLQYPFTFQVEAMSGGCVAPELSVARTEIV